MSQEKIFHLKAMGAEVVLTRWMSPKGTRVLPGHGRAARAGKGAFYVNQFANAANPKARGDHRAGDLAANGAQGRCGGRRRRHRRHDYRTVALFARVSPQTEMVLAAGGFRPGWISSTGKIGKAGSWLVEGIGEDFIPPVCDLSRARPTAFRTRKRSPPAGTCCGTKASWRGPLPGR